jgi:hypothetical protein
LWRRRVNTSRGMQAIWTLHLYFFRFRLFRRGFPNRRARSYTLYRIDYSNRPTVTKYHPDRQSYLAQIRLFDIDQEITRLKEISLLLDPEQLPPLASAASAKHTSVTCFVAMLSLTRLSCAWSFLSETSKRFQIHVMVQCFNECVASSRSPHRRGAKILPKHSCSHGNRFRGHLEAHYDRNGAIRTKE